MGWLDDWQRDLEQAATEPARTSAEPRRKLPPSKPKVHSFWLSTRNQSGADPGEVEECFYTLESNILTLTDAKGISVGHKTIIIKEGDNVRRRAGGLAREQRDAGKSAFQRRSLDYEPFGVA